MTLAAAFIGALVGGVLALIGNLVATRHELTRRHRVQLYGELVPRLLAHLRGQAMHPYVAEDIDQVERATTIAGRRDRRHAGTMILAVRDAVAAEPKHVGERPAFEKALGRAIQETETFEGWLAKRF